MNFPLTQKRKPRIGLRQSQSPRKQRPSNTSSEGKRQSRNGDTRKDTSNAFTLDSGYAMPEYQVPPEAKVRKRCNYSQLVLTLKLLKEIPIPLFILARLRSKENLSREKKPKASKGLTPVSPRKGKSSGQTKWKVKENQNGAPQQVVRGMGRQSQDIQSHKSFPMEPNSESTSETILHDRPIFDESRKEGRAICPPADPVAGDIPVGDEAGERLGKEIVPNEEKERVQDFKDDLEEMVREQLHTAAVSNNSSGMLDGRRCER